MAVERTRARQAPAGAAAFPGPAFPPPLTPGEDFTAPHRTRISPASLPRRCLSPRRRRREGEAAGSRGGRQGRGRPLLPQAGEG